MVLWVGWVTLQLVSLELSHWALFSWSVGWGLCLDGAARMAGLSLYVPFYPQEGLVELLYSLMVSGLQVDEGDSNKTSWVLGPRTCTVPLKILISPWLCLLSCLKGFLSHLFFVNFLLSMRYMLQELSERR